MLSGQGRETGKRVFLYSTSDDRTITFRRALSAPWTLVFPERMYDFLILFEVWQEIKDSSSKIIRVWGVVDADKQDAQVKRIWSRGCPKGQDCKMSSFFQALHGFMLDNSTFNQECQSIKPPSMPVAFPRGCVHC